MNRRVFLKTTSASLAAATLSRCSTNFANIAQPDFQKYWLSHPVIGDPSFDAFERFTNNPIYRGSSPYEWPVNGFLFRDPASGWLYAYIGMYPRGYWPPGGCRLLRSKNDGQSWQDLGVVLQGSPETFDGDGHQSGGMPDVSVWFEGGTYHLIYDWAKPDNSDGGLGYAFAKSPEGPFRRAPRPIHAESQQEFILGVYKRVYGGTLIKRKNDWLILAAMSTPKNAGGSWALIAMIAAQASGPYTKPKLLIYPQSKKFHPPTVEFYPCFVHGDHVYAPSTSVASNRTFQVIYRAAIEKAHESDSWEIFQYGSAWHAESVENEAHGLWGQTYSGFVDENGVFTVIFPSKDSQDRGTINLAQRPWEKSFRDGFVLSAPNGPSMTIFQKRLSNFTFEAHMQSTGPKQIIWNHNAAIGPDRIWHAEGNPHQLMMRDCTLFSLSENRWCLKHIESAGEERILAKASTPVSQKMTTDVIEIQQRAGRLSIRVNGAKIWAMKSLARSGSIGFIAKAGTIVRVSKLLISTLGEPCSKWLLPTEGILGSGSMKDTWGEVRSKLFRFGFGYVSSQPGAAAKWNYRGRGFRLYSPNLPHPGSASIFVDDSHVGNVEFGAVSEAPSRAIFEQRHLDFGFHAVSVVQKSGSVICDCMEIFL